MGARDDLSDGMLFTDQYQFTMAQVYFRLGIHERPAQFDHYFRRYPSYDSHQAGYCIAAGLDPLLTWMAQTRIEDAEIEVLRGQRTQTGAQLFAEDFLAWLRANGSFEGLTLRAIPEGRVVHPHVPLSVVEGPLAMAQILETALLNRLNFQTLVATKASRIRDVAGGATVMEFGLRRAQGRGGNEATRAALIGGADFSSNVGVSAELGLPARGTHAHSLVQSALALGLSELDAFRAFAEVYPDDTLLLVDTIDTLESGVPNAIRVFEELRARGHEPLGIRLDSGDLAYLSLRAAKMLDDAGFPHTAIVLSNDLDELVIWQILAQISQEARREGSDADAVIRRLVFGVGTHLVTSWGEPALGGVYKLVALHDKGAWQPAIKISETPEKTPTPGRKQALRLYDRRGKATADLLALDAEQPLAAEFVLLRHPSDARFRTLRRAELSYELLHELVFAEGQRRSAPASLQELRARREADVARLDPGVMRLVNPHIYHVSLSDALWQLKQQLIRDAYAGGS
jgi:nicotinate phosphoribosyltransferase